jgi:hypothetical protein
MRFVFVLTTFISLSIALPFENATSIFNSTAAEKHPAIDTFNYVSNQLATVVNEISLFTPDNPRTDILYRHAMETLESLRKGNLQIRDGPELDFWTTTSFSGVLLGLNLQIHQMTAALKKKKPEIDKVNVGLVFYTLLKQCYTDSFDMRKYFVAKMPSYLSAITQPIINEVVGNIESARDLFKPKDGDVAVVVVTEPSGPAPPFTTAPPAYSSPPGTYQDPPYQGPYQTTQPYYAPYQYQPDQRPPYQGSYRAQPGSCLPPS